MSCKSGDYAHVGNKVMTSQAYEVQRIANEKAGIVDKNYETEFARLEDCRPRPEPDGYSFDI